MLCASVTVGAHAALAYGDPVTPTPPTTPTATPTPSTLLADALRRDPARPLLTFHDHATGERTELSVATFANWAAKTANLLRDDVGAQPGDRVSVRLPLHWQAAVLLQAAWSLGMVVTPSATEAEVAVVTHDDADPTAAEVVSLGLGPMGLARPGAAPAAPSALDFDREVHGHGDRFDGPAPAPGSAAYVDGAGTLTAAALAGAAVASEPPGGALLVTDPLDDREAVVGGLLVPLAHGLTAVLCRHADPDRLSALAAQERVVAALGAPTGGLPAWRPTAASMP